MVLIAAAVSLAVWGVLWQLRFGEGEPVWGVTWSEFQAREALRLSDWRGAYLSVLDELRPQRVRLVAYWEYLEPARGTFDFANLDWQVSEAAARGVGVALVVGKRVPRWPECHTPPWEKGLSPAEADEALLAYLSAVVDRYRGNPGVKVWQVENEPFLSVFGDCPYPSRATVERELGLVRARDPVRPIMITDSGELSLWRKTAGLSEILGTTVYRTVWSGTLGWWEHLWPPAWYALRAALVRLLSSTERVVIVELQAEPWPEGNAPFINLSLPEQVAHFSVGELRRNADFARATGLGEAYLWGAEWWYWRKLHGDPSFWDAARTLFAEGRGAGM